MERIQLPPLDDPSAPQQRDHFLGELLVLRVALGRRGNDVHVDIANSRFDELIDSRGDVGGFPHGGVSLGGLAEINRIALAVAPQNPIRANGDAKASKSLPALPDVLFDIECTSSEQKVLTTYTVPRQHNLC
jgi:hypothetical protein